MCVNTKGPYVNYRYYQKTYHGSVISKDDFPHAELEAESFVNRVTFGRIKRLEEIPDCVKIAICSAAESMQEYLNSRKSMDGSGAVIKSENNDGYSVTYADAISDSTCEANMIAKINRYLSGTGLTYRGWSKKYDNQC